MHVCLYMCVFIYIYVHVPLFICAHIYMVRACTNVCVYEIIEYVHECLCAYVYMYVYEYICTHMYTVVFGHMHE